MLLSSSERVGRLAEHTLRFAQASPDTDRVPTLNSFGSRSRSRKGDGARGCRLSPRETSHPRLVGTFQKGTRSQIKRYPSLHLPILAI